MIVFHGSDNNELDTLVPQYYGGRNGSVDGIGNNATTSLQRAAIYAGEHGSVYTLDMDVDRFLMISPAHHLTQDQAQSLLTSIAQLPKPDQTRLYTDLLGKQTLTFTDEKSALAAYRMHKQHFAELGLSHDRLKPSYEFEAEHVDVFVARNEATPDELTTVPTDHLHYCLALYDNGFVTHALKQLGDGLYMQRNEQTTLLSFRDRDPVTAKIPVAALSNAARALPANAIEGIARHCDFFFGAERSEDASERAAPLFEALGIPNSAARLRALPSDANPVDALGALLREPENAQAPAPVAHAPITDNDTYAPRVKPR